MFKGNKKKTDAVKIGLFLSLPWILKSGCLKLVKSVGNGKCQQA